MYTNQFFITLEFSGFFWWRHAWFRLLLFWMLFIINSCSGDSRFDPDVLGVVEVSKKMQQIRQASQMTRLLSCSTTKPICCSCCSPDCCVKPFKWCWILSPDCSEGVDSLAALTESLAFIQITVYINAPSHKRNHSWSNDWSLFSAASLNMRPRIKRFKTCCYSAGNSLIVRVKHFFILCSCVPAVDFCISWMTRCPHWIGWSSWYH